MANSLIEVFNENIGDSGVTLSIGIANTNTESILDYESFAQEKIKIITCNWKPYAGEDLPGYGFTSEIVATAFEQAG